MEYFIKKNRTGFEDALLKEANGLKWLARFCGETDIRIPEVISVDDNEMHITAITSQQCSVKQMQQLGKGLAQLHRQKQDFYGFEEDNFIGLKPQNNTPSDSWGQFFVNQRLQVQLEMVGSESVKADFRHRLHKHSRKLADFLDSHCMHPSLVHGDLWSGNYLCDSGHIWLIDPAVYFADREVDMAMSEMFGGFPTDFYLAYDENYPRSEAYETKKAIYNLYHYMNHYNIFGSSYLTDCYQGWEVIEKL